MATFYQKYWLADVPVTLERMVDHDPTSAKRCTVNVVTLLANLHCIGIERDDVVVVVA